MRRKVIAGNWKMNMLPNEAIEFITRLTQTAKQSKSEIILCVPYIDLFYSLLTAQDTPIKIGAQNMHHKESGAYTGEISGKMLKSIHVEYVIIGHSERRKYFAETDEIVNLKLQAAFENNLKPILCVGETLEQREAGKAQEVITKQIEADLTGLTKEQMQNTIIAYEPIWAIGTGKTATVEDANKAIKQIREKIQELYGEQTAQNAILLYGGSVSAGNSKELLSASQIDGALIGGASLKIEEFEKIVKDND
ncbi:MAG: triose-phosphate isomerase [Clostridia bacterium]